MAGSESWQPTTFLRFEEAFDTSMGTARIVTDAGAAYIKTLGNRQGPHPLACEWVGTKLAAWLGIPTLEFALMHVDAELDEIPYLRGGTAASGTAFVTRSAAGHVWGGSEDELDILVNPADVSRLVVFDTWTRNCDRHPPDLAARRPNYDNVFLEDVPGEEGKLRLLAIDQGCCFTCNGDLNDKVGRIDCVKDDRLYGLFPAFVPRVRQEDIEAAVGRLRELDRRRVSDIVATIPLDWDVEPRARKSLVELICRRTTFVGDTIMNRVAEKCWPGMLFDKD